MGLSSFSKTLNNISGTAQQVRSSLNKLHGIFSSDTTNSSIRDRYNNGFYGDTTQFKPSVFSRLFDEPTYLTFRIEFDFSKNKIENSLSIGGKDGSWASLDYMPEPLLSIPTKEYEWNPSPSIDPLSYAEEQYRSMMDENNYKEHFYSTYTYLKNALGETQRAEMLKRFINALKDIQNNYPYYFTGVEGLNALSMVRPEKGIRVNDDNNTITINCMEGLDMKITQLMQLYRKIAWDDVYQRWILPDMMRFFNVKIYVSEIRLFHTMSKNASAKGVGRLYNLNSSEDLNATSYDKLSNGKTLLGIANNIVNTALGMSDSIFGVGSGASKFLSEANMTIDSVSSILGSLKGNMKLCDNAINDVMPTIVYDCKMCEFDISDTLEHISSLTSSKEGLSSPTPNIKIKVGKLNEKMFFPLENGLQTNGNKYSLDNMSQENKQELIYEDDILKLAGTRYSDYYSSNFKDNSPTLKRNRINNRYGETNDLDAEAYDPYTADKLTSLKALAGGVLGFLGTVHESEAIEGEHVKEVRNLYSVSNDVHESEAIVSGERLPNSNKEKIHESEAIINGERMPSNNKEKIHESEATTNNPKNKNTFSKVQDSEAIINGQEIDKPKPEQLQESTATTQEKEIQKIINEEGYENVLSAATSIQNMIKYIDNNDIIKSTATDEQNRDLLKGIVLENALDVLSTATDENSGAVKKLSNMIKNEMIHESTATNVSYSKRENIIKNTFNYLNGN